MILVEFLNRNILLNENSYRCIDFNAETEQLTLEKPDGSIDCHEGVKAIKHTKVEDIDIESNIYKRISGFYSYCEALRNNVIMDIESVKCNMELMMEYADAAKTKEELTEKITKLNNEYKRTMEKAPDFDALYKEAEEKLSIFKDTIRADYETNLRPQIEAEIRKLYETPKLKELWKDAQGNELPEIDREVIALQGRKVVFAHRPNPNGWYGKSLGGGKEKHFEPKTYDKGGWNMPDVTCWLDAPLPEGIK